MNVVSVDKTSSRRITLLITKEYILKEPYKCNQCGITFNQNSLLISLVNGFNLISYQKSHTGENTY